MIKNFHHHCIVACISICLASSVFADDKYWDGPTGGGWGQAANWATDATGTTDPASAVGSADVAFFNITGLNSSGNNRTINLNADRSAGGLVFDTASSVLIQAGGTAHNLNLGTSGIIRNSGSGAITTGGTVGGQVVTARLTGNQTWSSLGTGGPFVWMNAVQINTASASFTLTLDGDSTAANAIGSGSTGGAISNGAAGAVLSLEKSGSGTWRIAGTGSNTFTGDVTVNAGRLDLAKTAGLNAVPGNLTINGGEVRLIAANQIADASLVTIGVGGVLNVNGFSEVVGRINGAGEIRNSGVGSPIFSISSTVDSTFSGNITDTGGGQMIFEKQNTNTLTLTGTGSTFAGTLYMNNGRILFDNHGALGVGSNVRLGNNSTSTGFPTLEFNTAGATPANLSGKTFQIERSETIEASIINSSPNPLATLTLGTLTTGGSVSSSKTYVLGGDNTGANMVAGIFGGGSQATGGVQLNKVDAGTWILGGTTANIGGGTHRIYGGILALAKPAGVTAINAPVVLLGDGSGTAILRLDASNQIVDTATITFGQATAIFRMNGNNETITAISGASGTVENAGGGTSTLTLNSASAATFGGTLQNGSAGTLAFTKLGTGTLTLTGDNTYSGLNTLGTGTSNIASYGAGPTAGSGGAILLGHDNALGSGTLSLRGTQLWSDNPARTIPNAIDMTNGGGLRFGGNNDLTISGNVTVAGAERAIANYSNNRLLTLSGDITGAGDFGIVLESGASKGDVTLSGNLHNINRLRLHPAFARTLLLSGTGSTYTGTTSIESGTLRISSGNEQTLGNNPASFVANQLFINNGTLHISDNNLTLNDSNRGISMGVSGATIQVDSGLTFTAATSISGGPATVTKTGAGTFSITGGAVMNALVVTDGIVEQNGGIVTINTSSTGVQVNAGATYALQSGTLRTDRIDLAPGANFEWGNATLALKQFAAGTAGVVDHRTPGSSSATQPVYTGTTMQVTGAGAGLTTSSGSVLDLGFTYISGGVLYDQLMVAGAVTINPGSTLNFNFNPQQFRPSEFGPFGAGTLVLVEATGGINGVFDFVTGIGTDHIGFSQADDSPITTLSTFNPLTDLDPNTWLLEYDLGNNQILFHYNLSANVPEPSTVGFLMIGAVILRRFGRGRKA